MICPWCNHNNVPGLDQCENCQQDLAPLDRPVAHDRVERSLMDDTVAALEPHPAVVLPDDSTVGQAIQLMLEKNIGAVVVVDAGGRLAGIFSERDMLLRALDSGPDYASRPVSEFMTTRPETVRESDSLAFVLHKMDGGGYRHLPVLRDTELVGMISVRDVLRHITHLCRSSPGATS
jgi:CBS domain-containing protein